MALTIGEKVGAVIAFIHLVSTISGLIQAIIYYNRPKQGQKSIQRMNETAEAAHEIAANGSFLILKSKCNNKLWKASIIKNGSCSKCDRSDLLSFCIA